MINQTWIPCFGVSFMYTSLRDESAYIAGEGQASALAKSHHSYVIFKPGICEGEGEGARCDKMAQAHSFRLHTSFGGHNEFQHAFHAYAHSKVSTDPGMEGAFCVNLATRCGSPVRGPHKVCRTKSRN